MRNGNLPQVSLARARVSEAQYLRKEWQAESVDDTIQDCQPRGLRVGGESIRRDVAKWSSRCSSR
jgi:hypothetical protein